MSKNRIGDDVTITRIRCVPGMYPAKVFYHNGHIVDFPGKSVVVVKLRTPIYETNYVILKLICQTADIFSNRTVFEIGQ